MDSNSDSGLVLPESLREQWVEERQKKQTGGKEASSPYNLSSISNVSHVSSLATSVEGSEEAAALSAQNSVEVSPGNSGPAPVQLTNEVDNTQTKFVPAHHPSAIPEHHLMDKAKSTPPRMARPQASSAAPASRRRYEGADITFETGVQSLGPTRTPSHIAEAREMAKVTRRMSGELFASSLNRLREQVDKVRSTEASPVSSRRGSPAKSGGDTLRSVSPTLDSRIKALEGMIRGLASGDEPKQPSIEISPAHSQLPPRPQPEAQSANFDVFDAARALEVQRKESSSSPNKPRAQILQSFTGVISSSDDVDISAEAAEAIERRSAEMISDIRQRSQKELTNLRSDFHRGESEQAARNARARRDEAAAIAKACPQVDVRINKYEFPVQTPAGPLAKPAKGSKCELMSQSGHAGRLYVDGEWVKNQSQYPILLNWRPGPSDPNPYQMAARHTNAVTAPAPTTFAPARSDSLYEVVGTSSRPAPRTSILDSTPAGGSTTEFGELMRSIDPSPVVQGPSEYDRAHAKLVYRRDKKRSSAEALRASHLTMGSDSGGVEQPRQPPTQITYVPPGLDISREDQADSEDLGVHLASIENKLREEQDEFDREWAKLDALSKAPIKNEHLLSDPVVLPSAGVIVGGDSLNTSRMSRRGSGLIDTVPSHLSHELLMAEKKANHTLRRRTSMEELEQIQVTEEKYTMRPERLPDTHALTGSSLIASPSREVIIPRVSRPVGNYLYRRSSTDDMASTTRSRLQAIRNKFSLLNGGSRTAESAALAQSMPIQQDMARGRQPYEVIAPSSTSRRSSSAGRRLSGAQVDAFLATNGYPPTFGTPGNSHGTPSHSFTRQSGLPTPPSWYMKYRQTGSSEHGPGANPAKDGRIKEIQNVIEGLQHELRALAQQ